MFLKDFPNSPDQMVYSGSCHYSAIEIFFEYVAENIFWGIKTIIEFASYSCYVFN